MNIFILTLGTRGDLELFLTLGREMNRRGHRIIFGTSQFYSNRVLESGLNWKQIGYGTKEDILSALRSLSTINNTTARTRMYYKKWLEPEIARATRQINTARAEADYFISNLKIFLQRGGQRLPGAFVDYDPPVDLSLLPRYGVESAEHKKTTLDLVAMNRQLIDPEGLWEKQYQFTGFWEERQRPEWSPPTALQKFMEEGTPPVVMTMGSMVMFDPAKLARTFIHALKLSNERGLIVGGWSGISGETGESDFVYSVNEASYDWIFPKACCVIHHGGTGTMAAVLRSGRPSILLPQIACQEIYGSILLKENLAATVLDSHKLSSDQLAQAISQTVTDAQLIDSTRHWKNVVEKEDGVRMAADCIERHWQSIQGKADSEVV